jgi:drug/metabolite transporter (DMT)-like permease
MLKTRDKRLAYGAAISSAILMGSLGIFVRNISTDATMIAFARLSLGFMFLLGFLSLTRNLRVAKVSFSPYLLASGLSIGLCVWSYIKVIAYTSMANAVFLLYLGPLLAIGFAYYLLREKITLSSILLMCVAFVGFLFVVQFDFSFFSADALGYVYGLLSAFSYALIIVTNRKIPAHVSALGRSFYQLLIAALSLIPFLAWQRIQLPLLDMPWLLAVGFFQGVLGLTLMIFAIRHLTTYEYGILSYLEPVTAHADRCPDLCGAHVVAASSRRLSENTDE